MQMQTNLTRESPAVIVADARSFMRGCFSCWLDKFAQDLRPFITADAVRAVGDGQPPVPAAVVLSASTGSVGNGWLKEQALGLRRALPEVPIVVILDEAAMSVGQEIALSIGGQAFIPMSSSLDVAFAALRLVIAGGSYFPHAPAPHPLTANGGVARAPPRLNGKLELTPREQAVCGLLSAGLSNKLIARKLGMAVSTVKIHVHHVLNKLAVQNRTEIAIRMTSSAGVRLAPGPEPGRVPARESA